MNREASRVQVTVREIMGSGECPVGYKKGDTWLIDSNMTPANFCMNAFEPVYPAIRTMRYGGIHPWGDSEMTSVCCPDWHNPVVFEIKRLPPE
jgi:uncharacterized repeat protein (TIGR04076 family)